MTTNADAMSDPIDPTAIRDFAGLVWSYKQGQMVAAMIHLGDRLGLYRAMAGAGPLNAAELSERTGCHERWLLEWLRGQAAAKLLDYTPGDSPGTGRFSLSVVGSIVLADRSTMASAVNAFTYLSDEMSRLDRIAESFQTGIGLSYDDQGVGGAHRVEAMLGPLHSTLLVPKIIPALDGVGDRLSAGASVGDIGCGAGLAVLNMAKAFPQSEFHGYDLSRHAIDRALANQREWKLDNVTFHHVRGEEIPRDGRFDLVTTFDCIHDMTRPQEVIGSLRQAVRSDGTWLCVDVKVLPTYEENLAANPMLAMMYGFSIMGCMSSAMSEPGGAGLGTCGFDAVTAERMARAGGFTSGFAVHDFEGIQSAIFEIRP